MNRILVTGATGNVGRHVVDQLSAAGAPFRAMARDPDRAGLPGDIDVVRGDLTVPEGLDSCLRDIDTVFLVWIAPPDAIDAALERIATHARLRAWESALGQPAFVSATFAELTAKAPRSFLEWATDYAAEFRA